MTEHCSLTGLDLSEQYFKEIVRPLLKSRFPSIAMSAGLLGDGSEVIGFDTPMSRDHDWGPRVMLFLPESDQAKYSCQINKLLQAELPEQFLGYSTRFATPNQIAELRANKESGQENLNNIAAAHSAMHSVELLSIQHFISRQINFDLNGEIEPADWLTFSEQKLATITGGRVFEDEIGLQAVRDRFTYYPKDVWIYLLACQWTRIEQEEHLMGRAGYVGDETGSAIIAARLARDIMRLCFLMEKQYAPYPKWFGSAFSRLKCAASLTPSLQHALRSSHWEERQTHLSNAYKTVAGLHNSLALTAPMPVSVQPFHDRPFLVISMGGFSKALFAEIQDPRVKEIASKRPIGSIDQFTDNTDLVSDASWRPTLRALYE
jgi:Domain of unknown function (DUF4037)